MAVPQPARRPAGPSDAALVVAVRANEGWAFEALYHRYADLAYGVAFRLLGSPEDAEDMLQESFIEAFAAIHRLQEPAALRSWLCSVVVRRTCKLLRRRRLLNRLGLRRREGPIDFDGLIGRGCPPDVYTELRALYGILDTMPAEVRVVLVLRRVEGATLDEIAKLTGLSLATVKRRLTAAEAILREASPTEGEAS
ncbi:RNA polymerase sigma factor RpoE [Minicystis rosea]|nr:RNA polymerase sigma factor RpoE [Minicystis rosea]